MKSNHFTRFHEHIFIFGHVCRIDRNLQRQATHKKELSIIQLLPCLRLKLVSLDGSLVFLFSLHVACSQNQPNVAFKNSTSVCGYNIVDWLKMSIFHVLRYFVKMVVFQSGGSLFSQNSLLLRKI